MGYVVLSTDLSLENPVIEYTLDGNDIYSQQSVNNPSELSINHFEDMYSSYDNILISDNMITYSTAEAGSNAVYSIPCYPSANSGPTITGSNANYAAKNIYDLGGNVAEWTMEARNDNSRVYRGGYYGVSGLGGPASGRSSYGGPSSSNSYVTFRPVLYIK